MSFFDWAQENKIITVLIVIWALSLTTVITVKVFFFPVPVPPETVKAFGIVFGLPTLAAGLWKWRNKHATARSGSDNEGSSNG